MRRLRHPFLLLSIAGSLAPGLWAQAARAGRTERATIVLPAGAPDETVAGATIWRHALIRPGAQWLRVRAAVALGKDSSLRILDASGACVDRFAPAEPARWSRMVAGEHLVLELRAASAPAADRVTVDAVAVGEPTPVGPLAICGINGLLSMACQQRAWLVTQKRAVARLAFLTENGRWWWGTGFNVDARTYGGNAVNYMLTAGHNLYTVQDGDTVFLEAQYDAELPCMQAGFGCRFTCHVASAWERPDATCDWGVVAFRDVVGTLYGTMRLGGRLLTPGADPVCIIQHPQGRCKEFDDNVYRGGAGTCNFAHEVDTEPGSSGAPVLNAGINGLPEQGLVTGIHIGSSAGEVCPNFAVWTSRVAGFLNAALFTRLAAGSAPVVLGTSQSLATCTPSYRATANPVIGRTLGLGVTHLPPGAVVVFWFGARVSPPAGPVHVLPTIVVGPMPATGTGGPCTEHVGLALAVPSDVSLVGQSLGTQAAWARLGDAGLTYTNGLLLTVQP